LNGLSDAKIRFTSSASGTHQWYRYRENGNNAVPISSFQEGNSSYIADIQDGYGYGYVFGYQSTIIARSNIASVSIGTGIFFADVIIESCGGRRVTANGFNPHCSFSLHFC
jgi:hypothetical protein